MKKLLTIFAGVSLISTSLQVLADKTKPYNLPPINFKVQNNCNQNVTIMVNQQDKGGKKGYYISEYPGPSVAVTSDPSRFNDVNTGYQITSGTQIIIVNYKNLTTETEDLYRADAYFTFKIKDDKVATVVLDDANNGGDPQEGKLKMQTKLQDLKIYNTKYCKVSLSTKEDTIIFDKK